MKRWTFILLSIVVAACSRVEETEDGGIPSSSASGLASLFEPVTISPCGSAAIPFPNDLLFTPTNVGTGVPDATLNIPNGSENTTANPNCNPSSVVPFVTAANLTDGFSTTASAFTDFLGFVDFATAPAGILVVALPAGGPPSPLTYGTHYTFENYDARDTATNIPISQLRTRVLIEPLRPLAPSTTHLVVVTRNLRDIYGKQAQPSEEFRVVRSTTAVASQTEPILQLLNDTQKARLEALRQGLAPIFGALTAAPPGGFGINRDDIVIAWTFTTQSVNKTLQRVNTDATAQPIAVVNTTLSTGDLGVGLADAADIYAGTFSLPYYLENNANDGDAVTPLNGFWLSENIVDGNAFWRASSASAGTDCDLLAKSVSTTLCYPKPAVQSTETIPALVTVPNNNVCTATPDAPPLCVGGVVQKPAAGWPVVIFQHGITRNRTDMFAIAPALAAAGFVTVAIDHPLHGITNISANPMTNPFYRNQLFTGGPAAGFITDERTFNLDFVNNTTGAPGPDGAIDSSGTHFINLSSLVASRDNLRQSEADIIHLVKSIANLDLDNNPGALITTDIDETQIRFVGQSLGGIVGGTVLGVNTDIQAASLNVPGGGVAKLLDASASFGPRIAAGLQASGIGEGSDNYESFMRFAQHLVDPADPINYAVAASANHPIHMIEVIGDAVVPNSAFFNCASGVLSTCTPSASQDRTVQTGYLSGTDPLFALMNLTVVGPITPPGTATVGGPDTVVRFASGTAQHGTLLTPDQDSTAGNGNDTAFFPATCEMQRETAQFLATNGAGFQIGGSCP